VRQKVQETKSCHSWTPEEVEELRSSLRTSDIAAVDAEMFAKRLSEIVARARSPKKRSPVKRAPIADHSQGSGLLRRDDWDEASAADLTTAA
jgi:hypothetical protein